MAIELTTLAEHTGKRLDQVLKQQLPEFSRAQIQEWIRQSRVLVNGVPAKASYLLRGGERVQVEPALRPPLKAQPEDLPLEILYEDTAVIAVNKPAGMVVHAGAGVRSGTLVNALLHRFEQLSSAGGELRPGIVHRLDKDTSGVLLVARNDAAHHHLAAQFSSRQVEKIYLALVDGVMRGDQGRVDKPIARDPKNRIRMTARLRTGRAAQTEYRVLRRFSRHTLVEVSLGTGRTHQIRVHLASLGHPVAGDRLYGGRPLAGLNRFFLHAHRIRFVSPAHHRVVCVEAPLPRELEQLLETLL
ncbi:MAG: RluA family pseudouridine synthase [Bryobacteraceae bacterium]|nr:RluA family pseudouridine synthase [Bryobacteraceae bacterium]MDW8379283.1 RluA family pseudouridine synthase [Bryobacterales bacterium]